MATAFQVTFDATDPARLAEFWSAVLGYKVQDPPEGFDSWPAFLASIGVPEDQWNSASALVDPDGKGPRFFFQQVPEGKSAKNRVHLDVNVGAGIADQAERTRKVREEAARLEGLGATRLREVEQRGEFWIVLQDPEGNELCLQ